MAFGVNRVILFNIEKTLSLDHVLAVRHNVLTKPLFPTQCSVVCEHTQMTLMCDSLFGSNTFFHTKKKATHVRSQSYGKNRFFCFCGKTQRRPTRPCSEANFVFSQVSFLSVCKDFYALRVRPPWYSQGRSENGNFPRKGYMLSRLRPTSTKGRRSSFQKPAWLHHPICRKRRMRIHTLPFASAGLRTPAKPD